MESKYKEIVNILIEKTKSGNISWNETSSSDRFIVNISMNAVVVGYIDNPFEDDSQCYTIDILNIMGNTIEKTIIRPTDKEGYTLMEQLYNIVKRNVMKIDETLDEIISDLKKI